MRILCVESSKLNVGRSEGMLKPCIHNNFFNLDKSLPPSAEEAALSVQDLALILQKCTKERDSPRALRLHSHLRHRGLESHTVLGNSLVSLLAEVGRLQDAHGVFDALRHRYDSSWNSLISGYVKAEDPHHALTLYDNMRKNDTVRPNGRTYVATLKACTQLKNLKKGLKIHAQVAALGLLERDIFVGSTLVDMYAKCGLLAKAQQVFDELPAHNVVLWTALIGGYVEHGKGKEALRCFDSMQLDGIPPNSVTFLCSLKACAIIGDIKKGMEIHAEVERQGLVEKDLAIGNTLVYMYAKCGRLATAQEAFDSLSSRSVVSWTVLILGYAEHEQGEEALEAFESMQLKGITPSAVTFACALKACSSIGAVARGEEIHVEVERNGLLQKDIVIGNALVDMYTKCGLLGKAQQVFDKLLAPNVVTWTALISGYVECGYVEQAMKCFDQMQANRAFPNVVTLVCILKACGSVGNADRGRELHVEIERLGLLERDLLVANTVVDMYAKCGLLFLSQQIFDKILLRDVISWNALISGYAEHGHGEEVLKCLEQMQLEGVLPDGVTFVAGFKACGITGATFKGREIHAKSKEHAFFLQDDVAGSTLIDMYAKFDMLPMAQQVFDKLLNQNALLWTSLIAGYADHGHGEEALKCFERMKLDSLSPYAATFVSSLKACGIVGSLVKGQSIHADVERLGLLEEDPAVGSSVVFMYAKCGSLASAQQLFDNLSVRDVVSWSALIAGYADNEQGEEALECFEKMQLQGIAPNAITLISSLKACGCIGAADKGREIHAEIERQGLLEERALFGNTLVSMYAKCGLLAVAKQLFDRLPVRDVVSWTALMAGYAQLGQSENVFNVFCEMAKKGIRPTSVSFVVVLSACNKMGLSNMSQTYYDAMSKEFGIVPTDLHHTCMVDLFGRAGQLDKAVRVLEKFPSCPNPVVWRSMLGACKNWGNIELAKLAFDHALRLNERDSAAYVLMSHIYAGADSQKETYKLKAMSV